MPEYTGLQNENEYRKKGENQTETGSGTNFENQINLHQEHIESQQIGSWMSILKNIKMLTNTEDRQKLKSYKRKVSQSFLSVTANSSPEITEKKNQESIINGLQKLINNNDPRH